MDANFSQNISVPKDPSGLVSPAFLKQFTKDSDAKDGDAPESSTEQVRMVISGSDEAIQQAIARLQALGCADAGGWEPSDLSSAEIDKLEKKALEAERHEADEEN